MAETMRFLVGEEIELRPFGEGDAEAIFRAVSRNLEHLRPFLHWATEDYTLESAREFITRAEEQAAEMKNQGLGIFVGGGNFAGSIGFVKFNWGSRRTEIGYWIDKAYEGRGIITSSCRRLVDHAFGSLEMNRVEIRCATENVRSRAVPERLNFTLEGVLRQSEWRHDRFHDMAVYGMLKEEWKPSGR